MSYICTNCGAKPPKLTGKCFTCGSFNTIIEDNSESDKKVVKNWVSQWKKKEMLSFWDAKNFTAKKEERIKMKSDELNLVLWGWLVPGSFILLSWEPWVGKSTLTLQITDWFANNWNKAAYISCEENAYQVFARANRLWIHNNNISFLQEDNLENILATLEESDAELAIIDSISLVYSDNVTWIKGWIAQIKHIANEFMKFTKSTGKSIILIWHITKDGDISGPKTLEHLVDVVLFMEWDNYETFRVLRANKNRFWATDEIGIFDMTEQGFIDLPNPTMEFISQRSTPGNAIWVTLEGTRAILVEMEALTVPSNYGYPKRSSRWIHPSKLEQMVAVAIKYLKMWLDKSDCYVNIWRGLRVQDPANDLAIIASIYSSFYNISLNKSAFIWEVSLSGLIKNIPQMKKRVEEALKLWFSPIFIPKWSYNGEKNKNIIEVEHIAALANLLWKKKA